MTRNRRLWFLSCLAFCLTVSFGQISIEFSVYGSDPSVISDSSGASGLYTGYVHFLNVSVRSGDQDLKGYQIRVSSQRWYTDWSELYEQLHTKPLTTYMYQLNRYDDTHTESHIRTRFLFYGTFPGEAVVNLDLYDSDQQWVQSTTLTIQFEDHPRMMQKVQEGIIEEIIQAQRYTFSPLDAFSLKQLASSEWTAKLENPDFFRLVYADEQSIYPNQQFVASQIAIQRIFTDQRETLQKEAGWQAAKGTTFYHAPVHTLTSHFWFFPMQILELSGNIFLARTTLLHITVAPSYTAGQKLEIWAPRVEWTLPNGRKITNPAFRGRIPIELLEPPSPIYCATDVKMQASLEQDKAQVNEPVVLELTLRTTGVFSMEHSPTILFPASLEAHQLPFTTQEYTMFDRFEREYRFPFQIKAQKEGEWIIPPIEWDYFNLTEMATQTLTTATLTLRVEGHTPLATITVTRSMNGLREHTQEPIDRESFGQAVDAYSKGDPDAALILFSQLGSRFPDSADIHYNLGVLFYEQNRIPQAQAHYYHSAFLREETDVQQNIRNTEKAHNLVGQPIGSYRRYPASVKTAMLVAGAALIALGLAGWILKKKPGAAVGIVLIGLLMLGIPGIMWLLEAFNPSYAVIFHESELLAGPGFEYPSLRSISAGHALAQDRFSNGFNRVQLPDGQTYWIAEGNIVLVPLRSTQGSF